MSHTSTIFTAAMGAISFGTMLTAQTRAASTVSGVALALAWVIFESTQPTGSKRSLAVTGMKVIGTVVCGVSLPGMLREVFQENRFVKSLEGLWETWFLSSFLLGMAGWSVIYSFRRMWLRALAKAEHNALTDRYLGKDDVIGCGSGKKTQAISDKAPPPPPPPPSFIT